jgi:hypothetical protein
MEATAGKVFPSSFRKEKRMAYKKLLFTVLFVLAVFLVNIHGTCWAQPIDNTKVNKQDTSPKEVTVDQQVETKQDRKISPPRGLRILELSENPTRTMIKATDLTTKEPSPSVAADK